MTLPRYAQLRRTVELRRRRGLNPVSRRKAALRATRALVRAAVYRRADGHCECCGIWLRFADMEGSHRKAESQGGEWSVVNILCLCGKCHRHGPEAPHHRPLAALARGLRCLSTDDPAVKPVLLWTKRWVLLSADGTYREVAA